MSPSNFFYKDRVPWKHYMSLLFLIASLIVSPFTYGQDYISHHPPMENNPTPNWLRLNEINSVASRHFMEHFLSDGSERWLLEDRSYIAIFENGSLKGKAYYKTNGDFKYVIKTYGPDLMDKDIKKAVMRLFEGYSINCVIEITNLEKQVYFIKISNSENIKTLHCQDGKITVTESFVNGGG